MPDFRRIAPKAAAQLVGCSPGFEQAPAELSHDHGSAWAHDHGKAREAGCIITATCCATTFVTET